MKAIILMILISFGASAADDAKGQTAPATSPAPAPSAVGTPPSTLSQPSGVQTP
jgi:hypothetical protein